MVWKDPIIEEIHQVRADIMKEHDNDLHKLFEDLRQRQQARKKVSAPLARADILPAHPK